MPRTLEEIIREDLGRKTWTVLCQQQQIEALQAEVAALKETPAPEGARDHE